jgi:hypothetical protein
MVMRIGRHANRPRPLTVAAQREVHEPAEIQCTHAIRFPRMINTQLLFSKSGLSVVSDEFLLASAVTIVAAK